MMGVEPITSVFFQTVRLPLRYTGKWYLPSLVMARYQIRQQKTTTSSWFNDDFTPNHLQCGVLFMNPPPLLLMLLALPIVIFDMITSFLLFVKYTPARFFTFSALQVFIFLSLSLVAIQICSFSLFT